MKERLTGAIILVVLFVSLVPELLSGPSRSAPVPAQAAPSSAEEPPLRSYTIDLGDESHAAPTSGGSASAAPQASGPAQPTVAQPEAPLPAESQSTAATSTTTADSAAAQSSAQDSWGANPTPAPTPAPSPPTHMASSSARPVTPQHEMARQSPPPLAMAPARHPTTPPSPAPVASGNWMVQVGVFANHANAERLAQELKEQGFHTQVSENTGGGRHLWRVRAGPVAERAAAEQLGAKLRVAGHPGSVVPK